MIKSLNKKKIISLFLIIVMCLSNSWVIMATDSQDGSVESIDFMVGTGEELKTVFENADETPIIIYITDDITLDGIDIEIPEEVEVEVNITVKSDSSGVYTLTKSDGRHFICYKANLALENIILDGESTGGGVFVEHGNLTISDQTVIQNCFSQYNGGGVFVERGNLTISDQTVIQNCFSQNYGGGVFVEHGNLTISDQTVIQNCFSQGQGGGVFVTGSYQQPSTANVLDSTIINNNTNGGGGGLYLCSEIVVNIINSEISGNTAKNRGGGILLTNEDSNVSEYSVISGSIINDNTCSGGDGGGIWTTYVNLRLSDNEISGNKAHRGGGISCEATSVEGCGVVEFTNTTISGNIAESDGGGMYASTLTFIMSESEISENIAESGGGMCLDHNVTCTISESRISRNTAESGGGLCVKSRSSFTAENCEITENMAKYDSGVLVEGKSRFIFDGGEITNNTTIEDPDAD